MDDDASFVKAHKHAHGVAGGSKILAFKRGRTSKIHLAVDAVGRPLKSLSHQVKLMIAQNLLN